MDIVQFWSGGKDSTTSGILHLKKGDNVHFVCYIPFFDKDIPLISKANYNFLHSVRGYLVTLGARVSFVTGITYKDWCLYRYTRGKRFGAYRAYPLPLTGACGFNRDSKTNSCRNFAKNLNYDYCDLGFTFNEFSRRKTLLEDEMSLLYSLRLTDSDCLDFVKNYKDFNIMSPTYLTGTRDGCSLCPNAKSIERIKWFDDWKEFNAFERLYNLQKIIKEDYDSFGYDYLYPLRGKRYFIEDNTFISPKGTQLSIFDKFIIN